MRNTNVSLYIYVTSTEKRKKREYDNLFSNIFFSEKERKEVLAVKYLMRKAIWHIPYT
jgi:hypothetical protein